MNGSSELNSRLKYIEREITALKTAHLHSLGSVAFYYVKKTLQLKEGMNVITVIVEKQSYTPIMQLSFDDRGNMKDIGGSVSADNSTFEYYFEADSVSVDFYAVSSAAIISLTARGA